MLERGAGEGDDDGDGDLVRCLRLLGSRASQVETLEMSFMSEYDDSSQSLESNCSQLIDLYFVVVD